MINSSFIPDKEKNYLHISTKQTNSKRNFQNKS